MPLRHARVLLVVFILSILVRTPQLGRPMSKNHEFCTAVALIVMDVWWQRGFMACTGSPAVTYLGECDGEARTLAPVFMKRDGVRYYISHMPLAYWVPFAMFKVFDVPPSPVPLRLFNLLLHACTAFFFYRFLTTVLSTADRTQVSDIPLFAAVLYLLMPAPLWYHGNVYMSDMAVQLPWAWALASGARVFKDQRVDLKRVHWFVLAIACTALTEWMGLFIAISFSAYALFRGRRGADHGSSVLAVILLLMALAVVGLALWLYSGIAGWEALWSYYVGRWAERGTFVFGDAGPLGRFILGLPVHILTAWGPIILVLLSTLVLRRRIELSRDLRTALWLLLAPALMHVFSFLRYDGHEFSVLKLGFFLCTLGAMAIVRWRACNVFIGNAAVVLACSLGIAMYTAINRPGDGTATGDAYALAQQHGELIARTARMDERIYVSGANIEPQLMYYAHRNLDGLSEEQAATDFLQWPKEKCAIIWFKFTDDGCRVERVPALTPE